MTTLLGRAATAASGSARPPGRHWHQRAVPAGAALLALYVVLSFANHPHGTLGTDTGIKVATLGQMAERGTLKPDLGYWAAPWDPEARAHPFRDTRRIGDAYVDVTTLPLLYTTYPLWLLGGYRAALVLPMAGGVAAAAVARALARRLGDHRDGWPAFWLTGLASPVAVYALDLWEHTLGVALMAGAVVPLVDLVREPAAGTAAVARRAGAAGLCSGAAFALRTEALVYGAATFAVAGVALLAGRRWRPAVVAAGAGAAGFAGPALANAALEVAAVGQTIRSARAAGTVAGAGAGLGRRLEEGLVTLVSPFATFDGAHLALAATAGAALVSAAVWAVGPAHRARAVVAAGLVGLVALVALASGLGFWPGLLATTPLAGVGLARGWHRPERRLVLAMALVPVPLVILFQFTGGALPQWGGRYLLTTGLLLAVVGSLALDELERWGRVAVVALAVVVTSAGLAWLSVRTHQVAAALDPLRARPEPVLIWSDGFLPREFAAMYGERRWLAAPDPGPAGETLASRLAEPVAVAQRAGVRRFGVVTLGEEGAAPPTPPAIPGHHVVERAALPFLSPVALLVTVYEADGG